MLCEVRLVPRNNQLGRDWWRAERSGPSRVTWPLEVRCYEVLCDNSTAVLLATVLPGASFIMSVGSCSAPQRGLGYHLDEITAVALPALQSMDVNWTVDSMSLFYHLVYSLDIVRWNCSTTTHCKLLKWLVLVTSFYILFLVHYFCSHRRFTNGQHFFFFKLNSMRTN